jgi:transcriptional regulator with XRE-family HTH domain
VPSRADRHHQRRRRLGKWLREERETAELTQDQLGRGSHLEQGIISNIEIGERRTDVLEFVDIAAALGVPPDVLLNRMLKHLKRTE